MGPTNVMLRSRWNPGLRLHDYRPHLRRSVRLPYASVWWRSASCPRRSQRIRNPIATAFPKAISLPAGAIRPTTKRSGRSLSWPMRPTCASATAARREGWLWEVWNEPDIGYWHGTPAEYDRLYDLTAAAIRNALPDAKIGGPEATGISDHSEPFLRQFLEHCAHGKNAATGGIGAPLDFISYHPKGRPEFVDGHVVMSVGTQLRAVERGMQVVASYPCQQARSGGEMQGPEDVVLEPAASENRSN